MSDGWSTGWLCKDMGDPSREHQERLKRTMFVICYRSHGSAGTLVERRMRDQRVRKIVKALGQRAGIPDLHPHAFRPGCAVELLRRAGGNLRAVQEHLRHTDIQTTTLYTRLTKQDMQKVVGLFDKEAGS